MLAIVLAHAADLLTFIPAVAIYGIEGEGNPLARLAYQSAGIPGVVFLKVAGIAICLAVLWGLPDSTGKGIAVSVIAGLGVLGALTNVYAIALSR
jgi:hypothetical protein